MGALTGSVATKTAPNATPPSTRCQCHGTVNAEWAPSSAALKTSPMVAAPTSIPNMMRHDAIRRHIRIAAPISAARTDVCPSKPGTRPRKASHHVKPAAVSAGMPPSAAMAYAVVPA